MILVIHRCSITLMAREVVCSLQATFLARYNLTVNRDVFSLSVIVASTVQIVAYFL